jgi:flagellar basal-body rod protein FlgG
MFDAIYISAVGLQAQKEQLDAAANNMSNTNTTAYKRQRVDFSAILDRAPIRPSADTSPSGAEPVARKLRIDLAQGDLHATGRALDVAIFGAGFMEVEAGGGASAYSRGGSLQINADGMLALADGHALKADIRVPRGASSIAIKADGTVVATLPGDSAATVLGQIDLVTFANPESLEYQGEGLFMARAGASEPVRARPSEDGAGKLVPGNLEASNVRMVDEMVSLMLMQRVYELNAKVVQAADEMTGMTNNLRRA